MSDFDWRSPRAYNFDREADTNVAWECLRRNPNYQQDYQSIGNAEAAAPAEFRREWGLIFRG